MHTLTHNRILYSWTHIQVKQNKKFIISSLFVETIVVYKRSLNKYMFCCYYFFHFLQKSYFCTCKLFVWCMCNVFAFVIMHVVIAAMYFMWLVHFMFYIFVRSSTINSDRMVLYITGSSRLGPWQLNFTI